MFYRRDDADQGIFDSDFETVFTLRNGQVARFQEFCDSGAINAACQPR